MFEPFVDRAWLTAHSSDVVLVDVRSYLDGRSGHAAYEAGHLPGAIYLELADVLSDPPGDTRRGRHPIPSPERFAAGLAASGISDVDTVIAYDDQGGVIAGRLVWMLRVTGHDAALLDGGLSNYDGLLARGPASKPRPAAMFTPCPWPPERFATIDVVAASPLGTVLIDARDPGRFHGGPDSVDPRSGHIPGARNVPVREHIDPSGRIAAPDQLRERFTTAADIVADTEVISYCGSGVSACLNLLALERAGMRPGRLYVGSWSEWSRDPQRPLEP
jgi:thiosulfate/3-mercaptopyruvate sulfurtransferase